jgi:hypothetical protein
MPAQAVVAWAFSFKVNIVPNPASLNQSQSTYNETNCGRKNTTMKSAKKITSKLPVTLFGMCPPKQSFRNSTDILTRIRQLTKGIRPVPTTPEPVVSLFLYLPLSGSYGILLYRKKLFIR